MVSIISSGLCQPGGIVLGKHINFFDTGIKKGGPVKIMFPEIILDGFKIDISRARPWKEKIRKIKLKKFDSPALPDLSKDRFQIYKKAQKGLKNIIGLGDGLTPAGDDFIVGILNAIYYLKSCLVDKKWTHLWSQLTEEVNKIKHQTNDISLSFIEYGLEGRISQRALNLMEAILKNKPVNSLMDFGSSSGYYHYLGLKMGTLLIWFYTTALNLSHTLGKPVPWFLREPFGFLYYTV